MAKRVYIDFETRSVLDVTDVGAYKYASDPSTQIICFAYAFDDGQVGICTAWNQRPYEVIEHIQSGGLVVAHNANFDRLIWNMDQPEKDAEFWDIYQTIDTAAKCRAAGIPAKLGDAAVFLNLPYQKMTTGKLLVAKLSRPQSTTPLIWNENPVALEQMYEYCKRDVETMRALDKALPDLSPDESRVWALDQEINGRGVKIDKEFCEKGQRLVDEYKAGLDIQMRSITNGAVRSTTQVKEITKWAISQGATALKAIGKKDIADALESELPTVVRAALTIRKNYAKTSAAKLKTFLGCMDEDGRARDQYVYHGAHTGRWTGKLGQLQNLPKFKKGTDLPKIIDAVKTEKAEEVLKLGLTPSEAVSSCLRGMLMASDGKTFYGADFDAVEARVVAWLSGQDNVVDMFARKEDVYCYLASSIYGRKITPADEAERTAGKVGVLALGFGGAIGALARMAISYKVEFTEQQMLDIVRIYREKNLKIVGYWRDVEAAAVDAMRNPGTVFAAGPNSRAVRFKKAGDFLKARLPSGRILYYPKAALVRSSKFGGKKMQVGYYGKVAQKSGMFLIETYGGKLVENLTQGVARDCLVYGMQKLEEVGFRIVAHTHDEVICENDGKDLKDLERLMTLTPAWAEGLPLAVKGWSANRYTKG